MLGDWKFGHEIRDCLRGSISFNIGPIVKLLEDSGPVSIVVVMVQDIEMLVEDVGMKCSWLVPFQCR